MKKWLVGIDIGGTKISVSLGTEKTGIFERRVFFTRHGKNATDSVEEIIQTVSALLKKNKVANTQLAGIGVGVPGTIDLKKGAIKKSPNLPGWDQIPIKNILERHFRVKVYIENDANAAALGELYFGQGRKSSHIVYVTVSTGVGSGIIANGCLVRGVIGAAGEIGHMTLVRQGLKCPCGKRGCLEAYASGTAIANFVKNELRKSKRASRFFQRFKVQNITSEIIAEAASKGDRLAIKARAEAADFLGIGLANVINLLNPEKIILGGGVMNSVHHFWSPMMNAVGREAWPDHFKNCKIVRTKLNGFVGDLGCFSLILEGERVNSLRIKG